MPNVLQHSLGCDAVDPTEAAEMFSNRTRYLLLEHRDFALELKHGGPHRQ